MTNVEYRQNDTVPLQAELPVNDLNDASSVDFHMKNINGGLVIDSGAVIDDPDRGIVAYKWKDGETDRDGRYEIEWEVQWDDGTTETFPKGADDVLHFTDDIA